MLSQAQVVEDEDAHREAVANGLETEDGEGFAEPQAQSSFVTPLLIRPHPLRSLSCPV